MKNMDKSKIAYFFLVGIVGVLFFCFLGEDGVILTKDSAVFLGKSGALSAGYIIYPAFVRFFIEIFGEKCGLTLIYVVQSLLAYCISVYIAEWIGQRFKLSYAFRIVCFLLCLLPYGYTLPEYVLTHEIMTEGIAISTFNMLFILLLRWNLDRENKILCMVFCLAIMLVFVRPQLLTIFVATFYVCISKVFKGFIQEKDTIKRRTAYVLVGAMCVVVLLSVRPIMSYVMTIMPQFSHAVSGKVLFTMENDDRDYFSDIEQEAFDYVYTKVDEKKCRINYMVKDVFCADDIMVAVNDNTKFYISYFDEYCAEKEDALQIELSEIDIRDNVINTLLIENYDRYIKLVCQLLPYSFVAAIFIQPDSIKTLCYLITAILYLLSYAIFFKGRKEKISSKYIKPFEIMMSILVINVLLTNLVFYAQQRYVIYTFGWFYIAVLLMLIGLYRNKRNCE